MLRLLSPWAQIRLPVRCSPRCTRCLAAGSSVCDAPDAYVSQLHREREEREREERERGGVRLELGLSCGPQATLSKTSDSRSRPHIEIQHGRVLICICHGINCDRIASDGMGWWNGMVDGPIKRLLSPPRGRRRPRAQWPI